MSRCPSCDRPAAPRASNKSFPFCSPRCRLVDLGKWLNEEYRVPVVGAPDDEDDSTALRQTSQDSQEQE